MKKEKKKKRKEKKLNERYGNNIAKANSKNQSR